MRKEELLDTIENEKHNLINVCSRAIQIPSENPPGKTIDIANFLKDFLETYGVTVKTYEPKKDRPNLVSSIGSAEAPNLVLNAHMDEYPAETGAGEWRLPPFSGAIHGGRIYGRGSCDMKGGLAALVYTFVQMVKLEKALQGRLTLSLVSDEENMGTGGTQWLLDNLPEVRGDACLSGEASAPRAVVIGEKGFLWLRLKAYGKSAQGSYTALGDNAIVKMARAIAAAHRLHNKQMKAPNRLRTIIREQRPYWNRHYGRGTGSILDRITVSPGVINGGKSIGLVAAYCEAYLNTRAPIGIATDYIMRSLRKLLDEAGLRDVEIEVLNQNQPNYTSPEERIVEIMEDNVKTIFNKPPILAIAIGASDQWRFRASGIPTARYGPTPYGMGSTDEHILVRELIDSTKIHCATVFDYLT